MPELSNLSRGALVSVLLCGNSWTQSTLISNQTDRRVAVNTSAGERLVLFATSSSGGEVVGVATRPSPTGLGNEVRLRWTPAKGQARETALSGVTGTMQLFGDYVVFPKMAGNVPEPWILDLGTGQQRAVGLAVNPALFAASNDRLAILGLSPEGAVLLGLMDNALQAGRLLPLPALSWSALTGIALGWVSGNRLALIDTSEGTYTVIDPTSGQLGKTVTLTGAEIEFSKAKAEPGSRKGFKPIILRAHLKAMKGSDLFLLGPYKATEGYRLAEFDSAGMQVASYRLTVTGNDAGDRPSFSQQTVSASGQTIDVVSAGGTKRSYRRP